MIWLYITAVIIVTPFLLLIPKVHFSGSGSSEGIILLLRGLGIQIEYNSAEDTFIGRFLWFNIRSTPKTSKKGFSENKRTIKRTITVSRVKPPASDTARPASKQPKPPSDTSTASSEGSGMNLQLIKLLIPKLLRLLKRLLGSIHADELRAELIVATSDPMSTAIIFGSLQPLLMFNSAKRKFQLSVDFERTSPDFNLFWSFSTRPIVWMWVLFSTALTVPWFRVWRLTHPR